MLRPQAPYHERVKAQHTLVSMTVCMICAITSNPGAEPEGAGGDAGVALNLPPGRALPLGHAAAPAVGQRGARVLDSLAC